MTGGRRARLALGLVLAVTAAAAAFDVAAFEVTHDITAFMPPGEERDLLRIASALSRSDLARTMVLTVGADEAEAAERARQRLVDHLRGADAIESVHSELDEATQRAFYELYYPRRLAFVVTDPADATTVLSDEALRDRVRALKAALAGTTSPFIRQMAPGDPLLAFPALLQRLAPKGLGAVRTEGGTLVTADGAHFVVVATTRGSAFDVRAQGPFLDALRAARGRIERDVGHGTRIEMSGAQLFAVDSERSIRSDVQRISTVSVVAILLLYLLLFRSLRPPILGLAPIAMGFAVALAVVLAVSGRVHGVTLAFGAALIGVGIDYATHFFSHLYLSQGSPAQTMARVWPAVALGAITTVAGLAALALSPFPAMREIGLFAAVGVLAAMLCARAVLPAASRSAAAPPRTRRCAALLARMARRTGRPRVLALLGVAVVGVCAVGLPRFAWVDDVAALTSAPAAVREEAARVQARIGRPQGGRYVVVVGDSHEEALLRNERAAAILQEAQEAGELGGFQSVAALLPSAETQQVRLRIVQEAPRLWERLEQALADEGFRPELFEPFALALRDPAPPPLTPADLSASPLGAMVGALVVELEDEVAVLTPVARVAQPDRLAHRLSQVQGAHYLDQQALLEHAYGRLRRSTLWLIGLGLLLVVAALVLRYRRWRTALAVLVPTALSAVAAVAVQGLFGAEGNLMTVVGVLMVLSMGVDYGVFVAEAGLDGQPLDAPALSLWLGAATTSLSFGTLAASSNQALSAVGLTTALGVLLAAVLVPAFASTFASRAGRAP
jgi:predicted exporter